MKKAWKLINLKYKDVECYGCGAHAIELLALDCLAVIKLKHKKISNFFRNHHIPKAILCEYQALAKETPLVCLNAVSTRWSSVYEMEFRNLKLQNYLRIVISDKRCSTELKNAMFVKDFIFDNEFWKLSDCCIAMLRPIRNAIKEIEGNDVRVSVLPRVWRYIKTEVTATLNCVDCPLSEEDKLMIIKCVSDRAEFSIQNVQKAANMLDPRFIGCDLTDVQKADGLHTIVKIASQKCLSKSDVIDDYMKFKAKSGVVYGNPLIWETITLNTDPLIWWKAFCAEQPLFCVAQKFLSFPSTIACVERANKEYSLQKKKKKSVD
jgi:hypothetical protein